MNSHKVHSRRTVPTFSWEEKPGVIKQQGLERKTSSAEELYNFPTDDHKSQTFKVKLPPPPGPPEKYRPASFHDLQIPPPPCAFQPPILSSSSSRRKNDDPFLLAYKECTKSSRKDDYKLGHGGLMKKNINSVFSCKKSCSVVDDSIIRTSQLPISRSRKEGEQP